MKLGILIFVTCAACSSAPDAPVAPSDAGSDSELAQDAVADVAAEDIGSDQTDPQDIAIDQTISRGYPIRDVHQDSFSFSANENQKTIGQFTNYVPFYTLRVPNSVGIEDGVLTSVSNWTFNVREIDGDLVWERSRGTFALDVMATIVEFEREEVVVETVDVAMQGTSTEVLFDSLDLPNAADSNTFAVFHYTVDSANPFSRPDGYSVRTEVLSDRVLLQRSDGTGSIYGTLYVVHAVRGAFTTDHKVDPRGPFSVDLPTVDNTLYFYTHSVGTNVFDPSQSSLDCRLKGSEFACEFSDVNAAGAAISVQSVVFPDLTVERVDATLSGSSVEQQFNTGGGVVFPTGLTTPGFDLCTATGPQAVTGCHLMISVDNETVTAERGTSLTQISASSQIQIVTAGAQP